MRGGRRDGGEGREEGCREREGTEGKGAVEEGQSSTRRGFEIYQSDKSLNITTLRDLPY